MHILLRIGLLLLLVSFSSLASNKCFAETLDLISIAFFSPPKQGTMPYLLAASETPDLEPSALGNLICTKLGFQEGLIPNGFETTWTELSTITYSNQKIVYLGKEGKIKDSLLQDLPNLFGGIYRTRFPVFSKLQCSGATIVPPSHPCSSTPSQLPNFSEQDRIFDENKEDPDQLLYEMYRESRILALGESNHENVRIFEYLKSLLAKVGTDPHLKFIAFERAHDLETFFSAASISPITEQLLEGLFPSPDFKNKVLRGQFESDPYIIFSIFPFIQKINQMRSADNPLTLVPVDGATIQPKPEPPIGISRDPLGLMPPGDYIVSFDRELDTRNRFEKKILNRLQPGDKAIVIYHLGHILRNVEAYLAHINADENIWEAREWNPSNWLGMLTRDFPDLKSKIRTIAFDEKDTLWAPNGSFKIIQRQAPRYFKASFGIQTKFLKDKLSETGLETLQPDSALCYNYARFYRTQARLPEMVDAVIWSHDAHEKYRAKDWKPTSIGEN